MSMSLEAGFRAHHQLFKSTSLYFDEHNEGSSHEMYYYKSIQLRSVCVYQILTRLPKSIYIYIT